MKRKIEFSSTVYVSLRSIPRHLRYPFPDISVVLVATGRCRLLHLGSSRKRCMYSTSPFDGVSRDFSTFAPSYGTMEPPACSQTLLSRMRETVRACTKELYTSREAGSNQRGASLDGSVDTGRGPANKRMKQGQVNDDIARCEKGAVNAAPVVENKTSGEQETPFQVVERVQDFLRWLCQVRRGQDRLALGWGLRCLCRHRPGNCDRGRYSLTQTLER